MNSSIRIVAFDLGGVLVDVDHDRRRSHFMQAPETVDEAFFGGGIHKRLSTGTLSATEFVETVASRLQEPQEKVTAAWCDILQVRQGMGNWVDRTRAEVCAWSNTDPLHFEVMAAGLPVRLWPKRTTSFEVGFDKPEAGFYDAGIRTLDVAPHEILFLDDLPENIAGARERGISAERVNKPEDVERWLSLYGLL